MIAELLIFVGTLSPSKLYYNFDQLKAKFRTQVFSSSQIRSVDRIAKIHYQAKDETGKPTIKVVGGCQFTGSDGRTYTTLNDCVVLQVLKDTGR